MNVKKRVWEIVDGTRPGDKLSRAFGVFIVTLIFLNVTAEIVGTMQVVHERFGTALYRFEVFSVTVFSLEYLARVWSCVTLKEYSKPITGRIRYMLKPMALVDLLAILPFYLSFGRFDLRFIRAFRLLRIFRLAKLGRYSSAIKLFGRVFKAKKEELVIAVMLTALLIIVASSVMYFAENEAQPQKFPDIPTTLYWSVTALTVGFEVYPVTPLGKLFASIIALLGIIMIALPTGVLGTGFMEEMKKSKDEKRVCPHCGEEIE